MPPRPVKLIINPNADMGTAWRQAADLRPIVDAGGGADWAGTAYPTHADELARQAAEEGYEKIIAVGGDGTVHEILNGLMAFPPERRPRLGVVPMGSGNDFAHAIGVESDPAQAIHRALHGSPHAIDVGVVRDEHGRQEYWGNTLGIGFDATVTIRSHRLPVLRGLLMYLVALIQTILLDYEAPYMKFESDEERWEDEKLLLVACNGPREGAGFHIAPEARPDDGILHYATIKNVTRPMMFRLIPEVMRGTHARFPQVRMGTFRRMTLESDRPLFIHADGEIFSGFGSNVRRLEIEVLPGALEIVK